MLYLKVSVLNTILKYSNVLPACDNAFQFCRNYPIQPLPYTLTELMYQQKRRKNQKQRPYHMSMSTAMTKINLPREKSLSLPWPAMAIKI